MLHPRTTADKRDQASISMPVEKAKTLASHTPPILRHSFWLHPLMGYLFSLLLVALSILVLQMKLSFLHSVLFPGATFLLAIVLIAFLWGLVPAIFTLCLSVLALDYFYVLPVHQFNLTTWEDIVQMLPFVTFGLLVSMIIVQRGAVLQRARAAEYEQHKRASQLEAIFEAIADAVIVYDSNGLIVEANSVGQHMLRLADSHNFHKIDLQERAAHVQLFDEAGSPLLKEQMPQLRILRGETLSGANAVDIKVRLEDGSDFYASISGSPLHDQDGNLAGAVCIYRDVTGRRQIELSLRQANRRMDEFLGIASHELRTPLTAMKGYIQVADMKLMRFMARPPCQSEELMGNFDVLHQFLQRADAQAELLNRLVNDLLDVSRIHAGKLRMNLADCDLALIVRDAVYGQQQMAGTRSINLHLPTYAIPVVADADRIGQVVTNYLTNALKYSKPECAVAVCLFVEGSIARVEVHDEGPGLSAEQIEHIWERFYQVQGITVQSGSSVGLGIGLHICHTIISSHGGEVGVESIPGQGSTFWFTLPLVA